MANVENPYQIDLGNNLVVTSYIGGKSYNIKLNIHDLQTIPLDDLQMGLTFYVYNTQTKASDTLGVELNSTKNAEYLQKIYNNQSINAYALIPDLASYDNIGLVVTMEQKMEGYDASISNSILFKVDLNQNPQTFEMYLTSYWGTAFQYTFINNSSDDFNSGSYYPHTTIIAEDDWLKGNPAYDLFVDKFIDSEIVYMYIDNYKEKPVVYVSPTLPLPEGYKLKFLDLNGGLYNITAKDIDVRNLTNTITNEDGIVKWFDMGTMIIDEYSFITFSIPSGVAALLKDDSGFFTKSVTRKVIFNTPTTFPEIIAGAGYSYKNWYSDDACSITSSNITANDTTVTAYIDFDYTKVNFYYGYISWDESKARIKANFDGTYVFVNSGDRILSYSSLFDSAKIIDVHIYLNDTTDIESRKFGLYLYNLDRRDVQESHDFRPGEYDIFTDDDGTYIACSYRTDYKSSDLLIEILL